MTVRTQEATDPREAPELPIPRLTTVLSQTTSPDTDTVMAAVAQRTFGDSLWYWRQLGRCHFCGKSSMARR
jgi:hypothetical protein